MIGFFRPFSMVTKINEKVLAILMKINQILLVASNPALKTRK
jgi:hypothetical protein